MSKRLTQEYIEEYFNKYGYEVLCLYKSNKQKLKLKCPNGHITEALSYDSFRRGNCRCPECKPRFKYSFEDIILEFRKEGYQVISDKESYKNCGTKLETICPNGHIHKTSYHHFKEGRRCPKCKTIFKGEEKIKEYLDKNNINYIEQHRFKDCKYKNTLAFDFYLPNYNCCIEYDGRQHYYISEYFGGQNGFIDTKIRDTIKNIYCDKNNIRLVRIPYWEFNNIEDILAKEINQE